MRSAKYSNKGKRQAWKILHQWKQYLQYLTQIYLSNIIIGLTDTSLLSHKDYTIQ